MPLKNWYDLSPSEVAEAISHLDKGSFKDLSYDLVRTRFEEVSQLLPQDQAASVRQHLLNISPPVARPHIKTK